jgi:hypothetical protein
VGHLQLINTLLVQKVCSTSSDGPRARVRARESSPRSQHAVQRRMPSLNITKRGQG